MKRYYATTASRDRVRVVAIAVKTEDSLQVTLRPDYTPSDAAVTVDWLRARARFLQEPLRIIGGPDHGKAKGPAPWESR